jgi:hypothetical protein
LAEGIEVTGEDGNYSPLWWQTLICLPDDPEKALVGKEGQLLFDWVAPTVSEGRLTFDARATRGFSICLQPDIAGGSKWLRQAMTSPRIPIVQTWRRLDALEITDETFVVVPNGRPGTRLSRRVIVLMTLMNAGTATVSCQPVLRIRSIGPVAANVGDQSIQVGDNTRISGSVALKITDSGFEEATAVMATVVLSPGETQKIVFTVDRPGSGLSEIVTLEQAESLRKEAIRWWEGLALPYGAVQVPDLTIQELLESSVRNIWQARELKAGRPAFQVGPTWYRGLWVADGAFILETAAMLGCPREARQGIEHLLSHQKADGRFENIPRYFKENGIVLWAATRHACLTQDKTWLRAYWPALCRVMDAIRRLLHDASQDPEALGNGLMPGGFVDGGIDNSIAAKPEYSSVYWTLAGVRALIVAAHWLGEEDDARSWQEEYDELHARFRRACARDLRPDIHGNPYVPIMLGNADNHVPQKGQWSFCHAVYPGQIFAHGDPLVRGQLAMLRDTKLEGLVWDTGNISGGLWPYFASFYGHAQLWQGNAIEAAAALYAFAAHACPTWVWREEQKPDGQPLDPQDVEGDMPHNWASAEFIRLVTHLVELDRGDELHLLEGFPREWALPGMVTRVNGVLTPFGPLFMQLHVIGDCSAVVRLRRLTERRPARIVLHLHGLTGQSEVIDLPTDQDVEYAVGPAAMTMKPGFRV